MRRVGEDKAKDALMEVFERRRGPNGEVLFENVFQFVTATP